MGIVGEGVDLLRLVDKGANVDLYKQLGEWIDKVTALQAAVDELTSTNRQLEEKLRFKGEFQRFASRTYIDDDEEEVCSRCAEIDLRPVRLMDMNIDGKGRRATCPQCQVARGDLCAPISKRRAQELEARRQD
jgi:hypothetical protein